MADKEPTSWSDIPDEVRDIIFGYLPTTTLVWLNKKYYTMYHSVVADMIKPSRYQQYVTNMVIRDAAFFQFRHEREYSAMVQNDGQ